MVSEENLVDETGASEVTVKYVVAMIQKLQQVTAGFLKTDIESIYGLIALNMKKCILLYLTVQIPLLSGQVILTY